MIERTDFMNLTGVLLDDKKTLKLKERGLRISNKTNETHVFRLPQHIIKLNNKHVVAFSSNLVCTIFCNRLEKY